MLQPRILIPVAAAFVFLALALFIASGRSFAFDRSIVLLFREAGDPSMPIGPAWLREAFQGRWAEIQGDLDYEDWRRRAAASLLPRGRTAVFSHYVAINAVMSLLAEDDRVLVFRPDHASITTLATDGGSLRLVEAGGEASTGVH